MKKTGLGNFLSYVNLVTMGHPLFINKRTVPAAATGHPDPDSGKAPENLPSAISWLQSETPDWPWSGLANRTFWCFGHFHLNDKY